ncbi:MAG: NAD(P)/FAD-dependent oxidoreductase [Candidatus Omnitrophota bacterium]|nr:NAD(P)/FAD-dependent oxidoreductase [Candidatus Omnitrophota bacterium]
MNFLVKRMVMKRLDKEDKKFIAPHFRAGVVTPQDLRKIADVCEKFPESKIKLGTEIIIGGITEETRNEEFRRILDLPTFSVAGFCIRPVKICSGGFICDNNLQDSFSLGLKLDEKFSGRMLPFKMIISISGCARCCSEPMVRDIGIVACRQGYAIFVGGAAGARPRIGIRLIDNLSESEVIDTMERIIGLYEKMGRTPERLGMFIERIGFERFKQECQPK